jgi:pimeloyl-ACP methyl ester carboxylesterase
MGRQQDMSDQYEDLDARIGDVRARYLQAGDSGSPIVLLGGIGCSATDWENNIGALARQHKVYALDMLGDGLTDKPPGDRYGLKDLAEVTCDFLQEMGETRAHFVGNSLGGRIALECARRDPERVISMVLVAPAGVGRETHIMMRVPTLPVIGEILTRPSRSGLKNLWRLAFHNPAFVTEDLVETKIRLASAQGAQAAFLKTLRGFLSLGGFPRSQVEDLQKDMAAMDKPALVIWGKQDKLLPCSQADILRARLPKAEVRLFDKCGHLPQIEQWRAFNEAVLAFLPGMG